MLLLVPGFFFTQPQAQRNQMKSNIKWLLESIDGQIKNNLFVSMGLKRFTVLYIDCAIGITTQYHFDWKQLTPRLTEQLNYLNFFVANKTSLKADYIMQEILLLCNIISSASYSILHPTRRPSHPSNPVHLWIAYAATSISDGVILSLSNKTFFGGPLGIKCKNTKYKSVKNTLQIKRYLKHKVKALFTLPVRLAFFLQLNGIRQKRKWEM